MQSREAMAADAIRTWRVMAFLPIFGAVGSSTRHMSWRAGWSVVEYGRPAAATHLAAARLKRHPKTLLVPMVAVVGPIPDSASVWVRAFAVVVVILGLG